MTSIDWDLGASRLIAGCMDGHLIEWDVKAGVSTRYSTLYCSLLVIIEWQELYHVPLVTSDRECNGVRCDGRNVQ